MSGYNNTYNNSDAATPFDPESVSILKKIKSRAFETQYSNFKSNFYGSCTTTKNWSDQYSMPTTPPSVESIKNMTYQSDSLGAIPF